MQNRRFDLTALFGSCEAAPTTRNDFKAELVAREAGRLMRQH
jgi:hypothetical protein